MIEINNLVDLATIIGGFATAFAAAFAIVGIPLTYLQIRTNKELHREGIAKSLYREYLSDAVDRPNFLEPDIAQLKATNQFVQYELFVAHMLYSLEEILAHIKGDGWNSIVIGQLNRHLEYFQSENFQCKRKYYDNKLINLVDKAVNKKLNLSS